jgi:alkyl hydroperoxide reductase subunit F
VSGPAFDPGFAAPPPGRPLDPGRRYDALVLGLGPAGIAAALYLARKGLATGVIAQDLGGQVAWTAGIENYPGYPLVDGAALVARMREQLAVLPLDLGLGVQVGAVARRDAGFAVGAAGGEYAARALIVATGARPRLLGVPGEQRLIGRGVATCATCDAPLYRGKPVAVVGGGNSGLVAALDLARAGARVLLVQDRDRLTGDAVLERLVRAEPRIDVRLGAAVTEVLGERRVAGVRVRAAAGGAETELAVDGVFVEIGLDPNSEPVRGLAPLNGRGEIEVDCACRTSVAGLFAAGDVTSVPFKQIVIAAGEGAKAALSAADYLLRDGAPG